MSKIFVGVVIGVFASAFAREFLERHRPGWLDDVRRRAKKAAADLSNAFRDGCEDDPPIDVGPR